MDIVNGLLDKAGWAILLLVVGYVLNGFLEKSKARLAFKNEIAKQRVVYIGEVWSKFYKAEAASNEIFRRLDEIDATHPHDLEARRNAYEGKLASLEQQSRESWDAAQESADANRFWLGEALYAKFRAYHNDLMDLMVQRVEARVSGDSERLKKFESKINDAKQSITNYIENPL